jgi:hypothetical protein
MPSGLRHYNRRYNSGCAFRLLAIAGQAGKCSGEIFESLSWPSQSKNPEW